MSEDKFYLSYGTAILLFLLSANLRGWTFESVDEVKQVPKTVRDNPGVYREHYHRHYIYLGGK